jgi:hypothetical protein
MRSDAVTLYEKLSFLFLPEDFDFRFLTVPIVDMKRKFALAVGFETFLPSETELTLGSGNWKKSEI